MRYIALAALLGAVAALYGSSTSDPVERIEETADVEEITSCVDRLDQLPDEYLNKVSDRERVIVVYKRHYRAALYVDGEIATRNGEPACFQTTMGMWPYEPKYEFDNQSTPEGTYFVAMKKTRDPNDRWPSSSYEHALTVSYPNATDVGRAQARGVITQREATDLLRSIEQGELPKQNGPMGGAILLHSFPTDDPMSTFGCVGIDDEPMAWLFSQVEERDPIVILPYADILFEDGTVQRDEHIPERTVDTGFPFGQVDVEASREEGEIVMKPMQIIVRTKN